MRLCWQIYGTSFITNNDLVVWVVKGFIVQEKGIEINWVAAATWTAKEKCRKMEVLALKFEGTDLSGPCVSRKLSTNGNSTKSNVHLVSDCEALKTSCSTCPYGVVANYLKQVEDLVSCLFELLKCSQFKVEHLQCEKMKAGENLIGHRFAMVDQNVRPCKLKRWWSLLNQNCKVWCQKYCTWRRGTFASIQILYSYLYCFELWLFFWFIV